MPYGWEGNPRSGVALTIHHRLQWLIHIRAQWPNKGDENPTYNPLRSTASFTLNLQLSNHFTHVLA